MYTREKSILNEKLKSAKQFYNSNRIRTAKCKQNVIWKIVNENCTFISSNNRDLPEMYINETKETKTTDPVKKVTCLNEYFVKIPQNIHSSLLNNQNNNLQNVLQSSQKNMASLLFICHLIHKMMLKVCVKVYQAHQNTIIIFCHLC